jgi:cob(I)alamin adenosyltransferase
MGNRLSVIATRTGDEGHTGLGDGSRVSKDTTRIVALGEIDELNSVIGLLLTEALPAETTADLRAIQHHLFDIGAELCMPGHRVLGPAQVSRLDARLEYYNANLPALREFILPGGTRSAAMAHLARTVCRRAERTVVTLGRNERVNASVRQYLNRLSDLMFVLARQLNRQQGVLDSFWNNDPAGKNNKDAAAGTATC